MSVIREKVRSILQSERMNFLSTSDKNGVNNIAVFGSLMLGDNDTLKLMLGENRSYANLRENPNAALLVVLPGKTGMDMEGCRLYLKVRSIEDSGESFDRMKSAIKASIGDAAEMLKHLVTFDVSESRPIVDMGQGI